MYFSLCHSPLVRVIFANKEPDLNRYDQTNENKFLLIHYYLIYIDNLSSGSGIEAKYQRFLQDSKRRRLHSLSTESKSNNNSFKSTEKSSHPAKSMVLV